MPMKNRHEFQILTLINILNSFLYSYSYFRISHESYSITFFQFTHKNLKTILLWKPRVLTTCSKALQYCIQANSIGVILLFRAIARRSSMKKVFLKILQAPVTLLKKRL